MKQSGKETVTFHSIGSVKEIKTLFTKTLYPALKDYFVEKRIFLPSDASIKADKGRTNQMEQLEEEPVEEETDVIVSEEVVPLD